VVDPEIMNSLS